MMNPHPPSLADALPVLRLLTDVAALRHEPARQRQVLIDGLHRQFNSKLGWLCVADGWRPGRQVKLVHQVLTSDARPDWLGYMSDFSVNHPIEADPYADHSIHRDERLQVFNRRDAIPDAATEQKYPHCMAMIRLLQAGDAAIAVYRDDDTGDRIAGFALHRDEGAPPFSAAEFGLMRLAIEEIRGMERRGTLAFRAPTDAGLTPRLQQVLDHLLAGKAPKQIAHDLQLSVHTVREYVLELYDRFDVQDRAGLTSKFLRA